MGSISNKYGFHTLYTQLFQNWSHLEGYIANLPTEGEKGDAFEQFCYFYLVYHKDIYKIDEVWCDKVKTREIPNSIRTQYNFQATDYGVDGVCRLQEGRVEAWQAKFRSDRSSPSFRELSTFWAEAEYADVRRIISNSKSLPRSSEVRKNHIETLVDKFINLSPDFFEALHTFANTAPDVIEHKRYSPLPHQERIITDVVSGLQKHERGKLIAACGIGKTLTALWITEVIHAQRVLVLAPSIALVGQTLREWVMHRTEPFTYLGVCSDATIDQEVFESDISTKELDFSVTTNVEEIINWIKDTMDQRQYIFCTYQSSDVIEQALRNIEGYVFDIIIFDEAHRTVGKADQKFATALSNECIAAHKRLFMTATEKLISPRVASLAESAGTIVFSMSDETVYGPTLCEYNFGRAIQEGIIADYEIVLAEVTDTEEQKRIQKNRLLQIEVNGEQLEISASELFKAAFLLKSISQQLVSKTITFHAFRKNAIVFNEALINISQELDVLLSNPPYFSYVLGDQNAAERATRIGSFEAAQTGVLGNVQVLSEGVDIPLIDSVYFVDPKTSLIDLVQAIGRALRKPYGKQPNKIAKIIVPILLAEDVTSLDDIDWDETLKTFHNVIQAMRDQDARLAEEINAINQYAVTNGVGGRRIGGGRIRISISAPSLDLRENVSLEDFYEKITLRVATANANPDGTKLGFSHLGKGQRRSKYKPLFSVMGDYNPAPYRDELVIPTLERFTSADQILSSAESEVNNNNRSHCKYLGIIKELEGRRYCLTYLGKLLYSKNLDFETLFKNQLMVFENNGLYPYRLILKLLLSVKSLNNYEFLYGPYIVQPNQNGIISLQEIVHRIQFMRERFPQINLTNIANRDAVREQLNEASPVLISDKDLWGDRTTVINKFRYVKNALSLYEFIDAGDGGFRTPLTLKEERKEDAIKALIFSKLHLVISPNSYGEELWINRF